MVKRAEGYVLVTVLIVIALLMAAGALLAGSLQYRMWLLRQESQTIHLAALTDAGIAQALERLSIDQSWRGADVQPLGDGAVEVAVDYADHIMAREVLVTATYGNARQTVLALVRLDDHRPPKVIGWEPVPPHATTAPGNCLDPDDC
ncbi:MAG: hypothetical protein AAF657_24780 [Acidobacteriota bacterium]